MDRELGEFFVKFTTSGLAEVKDAIDGLTKKMDEVGKATEKANSHHSSFFGNLVKWGGLLIGFTSVVAGLKAAWNGVAEASARAMDIYQQSLYSGASPQTLERWQKVAQRNGLPTGAVTTSFNALYRFLYDYENAQIPGEEFNKKIGLALRDTNGGALIQQAIMRSVKTGNADAILSTLNRFLSSGLIGSQASQDLLSAFGINNVTFQNLLSQRTLADQLQSVPLNLTGKQETIVNSAKYTEARAKLAEATEAFWIQIQPAVTKLITWFADTAVPAIRDFTEKYWPEIEKGVKWLFNWIMEKLGILIEKFGSDSDKESWADVWERIKVTGKTALGGAGVGALGGSAVPGIGTLGGAIVGGIAGGLLGWNGMKSIQEKERMWNKLTPAEQFSLFSHDNSFDYFKHDQAIPSGTIETNNKAVAIINIDGHEVQKTESGNIAVLDYTSPINIPMATR